MAGEGTRRVLHDRLADVLGTEVADHLMDYLPPAGWSDLATKRDLDALAVATKKDLDAQTALFKKDLDARAALLKKDLDAHAALTKRDMDALESRLRAEMAMGFARMTRTFVVSQVALVVAMIGSLSGVVATLAH